MGRLTRRDWLVLALARLTEAGPDALKLEAICEAAGKTRGSFYHHFEDHDAFLLAVTRHWVEVNTDAQVGDLADVLRSEAHYQALMARVIGIDQRTEYAIRQLADQHDGCAALVRETDARRIDLSAQMYARRFALDPERASDLARCDYAAFAGLGLIAPGLSEQERLRCYELFDDMVIARYGPTRLEVTDD